jgi:hypothetical protein
VGRFGGQAGDGGCCFALGFGLHGLLERAALRELGEAFGGLGQAVCRDELGADVVDAGDLLELVGDALGGEPGL